MISIPGGRLVMASRAPVKSYLVPDEAMNDASRKSIPMWWIINIDPTRKPRAGQVVMAETWDGTRSVFRELVRVRRRWMLRAWNTQYNEPAIDLKREHMRILGVAVSADPPSISLIPANDEY